MTKKNKRSFKDSVRRFYTLGGMVRDRTPDKYRAVTLRSMTNGRIEIRAPGNENYQLRSDKIANILTDIEHCVEQASNYISSNHINKESPLHPILGKRFKGVDESEVRRRFYNSRNNNW